MSSNGWQTYKLNELIEIIGGGTPKTTISEYWNGDIPWLSVVDFGGDNKYVYETEKSITNFGLQGSSTKILKKGQLIISARGTVGELAVLGKDMAFNQSCYGLNANCLTFNDFLYYLIKNNLEGLKRNTNGAVFDTITQDTFNHIEVNLPPIRTQQRIASILSSLDDKIELNRQTNATLEAIAQAIFKEWFVDFRFPGATGEMQDSELGMIPKGWRVGRLGDVCELAYGKGLKSEERVDGNYPVVGSNGIVGSHNNYLVQGPGIVIGRKGTIGNVTWINENFFPIDTTFFIKDMLMANGLYFHFFLLEQQDFKKIGSDSAVPGLNRGEAYNNKVIIPSMGLVNQFNDFVKIKFDGMHNNNQQTTTLAQIRDALLPKLMRGEIVV